MINNLSTINPLKKYNFIKSKKYLMYYELEEYACTKIK